MPPAKRIVLGGKELDKLAWSWIEDTTLEQIERKHLETAYRIGLKICKNCKRNCTNNPLCLTGLGEDKYLKSFPAKVVPLESSLSKLRDPTQYVGLKNLGATCYVNSLIQMWFHNVDMRKIIYEFDIGQDPEEREAVELAQNEGEAYQPKTALGQLQYIFLMMQFGNQRLLDPTNLAVVLQLDTRLQQDAQEFSKLLLCHIEGKLQYNLELKRMLLKLFQGKYSYINCCSTCGTEYPTSTTFYELDLQLAATLTEAIEKYLSEEQLTGSNQYHCVTCNDKKDARRFIRLESLPETLNIQLMRFVFHRDSGQKRKLTSFIQFPEDLDMSEYMSSLPKTHLYSLVAILSHKGQSAHSGHYIANICHSNGEWYQFSDDKVEKMQNKRIEDDVIENGKPVKRSRVPKGSLSSNTAYMLVYKKITSSCSTNGSSSTATRKVKIKKIEAESNDLNGPDKTRDVDPLDLEQEEKDKIIPECVDITDQEDFGRSLEPNDVAEERMEDVEEVVCLDQHDDRITEQISKIDYTSLNGEAHRAMSCGERDMYEDIEFERWGVNNTMRDLVRDENIKHELSLLAVQQEKQKEIEDQNLKRQLVIDVYDIINNTTTWTTYEWIASDWFTKWVGKQFTETTPPIDNSLIICLHHKLDPLKVNRVKCLPVAVADILYSNYQGGPRMNENSFCEICVKRRCKKLRFTTSLERDNKEVADLARKEPNENSYIIGTYSLKSWRRLAMDNFNETMEKEIQNEDNEIIGSENNKTAVKDHEGSKEPPGDSDEDERIINFNEDLLCEHDALKTPHSSRKIVPREVWLILKKYFPDSKEYPINATSCSLCEEKLESAQKAKKDDAIKAKQQRDELNDLYHGKNRNEFFKCHDPDKKFYIVERGFLDTWRTFIRYAESLSKAPPSGIQNALLLCELHKGFLQPIGDNCDSYCFVNAEEWAKLEQFYQVDHEISIQKLGHDYLTNPGLCTACMLERMEKERLDSLNYDRASIYVKYIDESEDKDSDSEVASKKPKIEIVRPSRMRRKIKGSHEFKVSSDLTLKDLKLMTMSICGAGPYDQHLMLGEHELTDDSQSLAALGIFPNSLLTLKIDVPTEMENEVSLENPDTSCPEKGFKGTELIPS